MTAIALTPINLLDLIDLNKDDRQQMTSQLRSGIVEKKPEVVLEKEVEMDEVYLVKGFKGQPPQSRPKAEKGSPMYAQRKTGKRNFSPGKATDFWHDAEGRRSGHQNAGKCAKSDN